MTEDVLSLAFRRLLARYDEMARALVLPTALHELLIDELLSEYEQLKKASYPAKQRAPLPATQAAFARLEAMQGL